MSDDETYNETRLTIWSSQDLADRVDERVEYGPPEHGSRSAWVREAIQLRMVIEDALEREGIELPEEDDDRERYLRRVAEAGIDTVGAPETE